jgi:hypothetical protein
MKNHVEQRELFVGKCGPENEAQIETYSAEVLVLINTCLSYVT